MAFTYVSPGHQYTVGPHLKRLGNEVGVHATGAHQADDAHVGRILQPADTGQIGGRIGTPVTGKGYYFRFEFLNIFILPY